MDQTILLVLVIVVLLAAVGWLLVQRRKSDRLQSRFGPEYKRTLDNAGDRRAAEEELETRQRRVAELEIRPLSDADRQDYATRWRQVQANFVDEPRAAITDADGLIGEVMHARGYPVSDFNQQVADVSVDHASVVEHYRAAHEIASRRDDVTTQTEDLRQAMVHYRALFEDLLGTPGEESEPSATDRVNDRDQTRKAS
jgi:hypothetical protein